MGRGTGAGKNIFYYLGWPLYLSLLFFFYLIKQILNLTQNALVGPGKTTSSINLFFGSKRWSGFFIKLKSKSKFSLPKPNLSFHLPARTQPHYRLTTPPYRLTGLILGVLFSLFILYSLLNTIFKDLPSPNKLSAQPAELTTKIFDRNGVLLYKIYQNKNRTPVKLIDLPAYVPQAIVAIEDKDFYNHQGISVPGITRALYETIIKQQTQGGSTITQQLIKNTLLSPEKTLKRKAKEAVLAFLVEKKYTKNQILEMYLNEVGYGGTAYGIEEAAQRYFGIPATKLSLAQAALLAGLPASPTQYSPFGNHPDLARTRQIMVLERMQEDGYITPSEKDQAINQPIIYTQKTNSILAPHFVMFVRELLAQKYGDKTVEQGGLEITTSLDINIQNTVQAIVRDEVKKLGNLHITNGAVLVTNPKTGEILAMVGSKDYFAKDIDGNYNVTTALRQPGSSIKPVNYSIALENGFTPGYLIDDSPITYKTAGQPPYSPTNYDRKYHGLVPLRVALGSSYNVPAVKVLAAFGVDKMIERGKEMGITSWNDSSRFGLALTLGGGEVKMIDMALVYGILANEGIKVELNPILEVKDSQDKVLEYSFKGFPSQALKPETAYLLTNILADNTARTPAFGPKSLLYIPNREVAVKTGTTQNMRDNWTIGYTPSWLTVVWVGNNDNSPMSYVASGITGASPIWRQIMDYLLIDQPIENFPRPENIEEVTICQASYTLLCDGCPNIKKELFIKGTAPKSHCNLNQFSGNPPTQNY